MRILSGDAALRRVSKLEFRSTDFAIVEPKVHKIVDDVRRRGDRALRNYATKLDGLARNAHIRVSQAELKASWALAPRDLRRFVTAGGQ